MKHSQSSRSSSESSRLVAEARRQFSLGRPNEAETILGSVLEANPRHLEATVALGIVAAETGRTELAAQRMAKALEIDPKCVFAMCWLSHLLTQSERYEEAQSYAEMAVSLDQDNARAFAALGHALSGQGKHGEALASLQQAHKLDPRDLTALYGMADSQIASSRETEAIQTLRKAVALSPDPKVLLRLAHLELQFGSVDDAERFVRKALAQKPDSASAHLVLARILTEQRRLTESAVHWQKAQELNPRSSAIHFERAMALKAIGQFDMAIEELRLSIELNPMQGAAYQAIVFAKRVGTEDLPLVDMMCKALDCQGLTDQDRMSLMYSLGKAHNDLDDYEAAIRFFDRANLIRNSSLGAVFDRQACKNLVEAKLRLFTPGFFGEQEHGADSSDLPIAVFGMMRSGTTFAEQMLSCHPKIRGAGELGFWGKQDEHIIDYARGLVDLGRLRTAAKEYVKLLSERVPGFPHVIDKNPANLNVAGSMHLALPNMRFIQMRRNAVDTALSIWMTPMTTTASFVGNRGDIVYAFKQFMRLMDHWRDVMPSGTMCEMRYEDLVADPERYGRRLVEFCGVEWNEACLHPELNERRVTTPSLWQVRQPIYRSSTDRWKKYEPWLGPFQELMGMS